MAQVVVSDFREVIAGPNDPYYPGQGPNPTYPMMFGHYHDFKAKYVAFRNRRSLPADTRIRMDHVVAFKTKEGSVQTPGGGGDESGAIGVPNWVLNAVEKWDFV